MNGINSNIWSQWSYHFLPKPQETLHNSHAFIWVISSVYVIENKTGIICQYTWPQCVHSSENHLNQKLLQKSSPWSPASGVYVRMRHERFKITITPLRQWKHTCKHSALFGNDNGQYSTSCKPSQDVSKRSREQIHQITISTPQKIKSRLHFKTWPTFGEGQVMSLHTTSHLFTQIPLLLRHTTKNDHTACKGKLRWNHAYALAMQILCFSVPPGGW